MELQLIPLLASDQAPFNLSGDRIRIGRAKDCDIRIEDCHVSRHHCELIVHDDCVFVRDLHSRNGTRVNDRRVQDEHPLRADDILAVARISYRLAVSPPKSKETPNLISRLLGLWRPALNETQSIENAENDSTVSDAIKSGSQHAADVVDEAGVESFPASDPPAWTSSRV